MLGLGEGRPGGSVETGERIVLCDAYNGREGTIANYVLMVAIPWGALRRAGIDPASPRGDLLTGLWKSTVYLVLPLLVAAVCGQGGWSSPRDVR